MRKYAYETRKYNKLGDKLLYYRVNKHVGNLVSVHWTKKKSLSLEWVLILPIQVFLLMHNYSLWKPYLVYLVFPVGLGIKLLWRGPKYFISDSICTFYISTHKLLSEIEDFIAISSILFMNFAPDNLAVRHRFGKQHFSSTSSCRYHQSTCRDLWVVMHQADNLHAIYNILVQLANATWI